MLTPGLVSITFRKLAPEEIIELVRRAGLKSIEWGGDIHAPHGDVERAKEVRRKTEASGLQVAAYGSYYRLGKSAKEGLEFGDVLNSAVALGAPQIRVWAGAKPSAEADPEYRREIADEANRIAEQAAAAGLGIAYEYHANTLTDTNESAQELLSRTDHPNITTLWQPPNGQSPEYCLEGLKAVLPRLSNVHVFHWWPTNKDRNLIEAGTERWKPYLDTIRSTGRDHHLLIEFVKDNEPENFLADAATLLRWIGKE